MAARSLCLAGVGVCVLMMSWGCAAWVPAPHLASPLEQPFDRGTIVIFDSSGATRRTEAVPLGAYRTRLQGPDKRERGRVESDRIHPLLVEWLRDSSATQRVDAIVTFRDPIEIPRFPEPHFDQPRGSAANLAVLAMADSLKRGVIGQRVATYAADSTELALLDGVQVLRTFWIIRAMRVRIALGSVKSLLSRRKDITYVAPNASGEPPPAPTCAESEGVSPRGALQKMNASYLRSIARAVPWMSVFDCGINTDHGAFRESASGATPRLGRLGDCREPGCEGGDHKDDSCDGHGTASAAILASLPFPEECWEGMVPTQNGLDVFRVFDHDKPCPEGPELNRAAVVEAFEQSIPRLDRVIAVETQAHGGDGSDIADAANQAYNAGAVVVGAQGNIGVTEGVEDSPESNRQERSPGNAHRAIAAGGYNVGDTRTVPANVASQCVGPTEDGRIKPEVLGPSHTFVAGVGSGFRSLGFTSGATPYVAGALALLRSELAGPGVPIDPGQLYAALLACGQEEWVEKLEGDIGSLTDAEQESFDGFHRARGTGRFLLPGPGCLMRFDRVSIRTNTGVTLDVNLTGFRAGSLDVALWWPDLHVFDPLCINIQQWPTSSNFLGLPGQPPIGKFKSAPCARRWYHSDIDLKITSPTDDSHQSSARSYSKGSVFERAGVRIKQGHSLEQGKWRIHVIGRSVPFVAAEQTVYCAVIVRPAIARQQP